MLHIPVGIPGCGKSTVGRTRFEAIIHSSDAIRQEIYEREGVDPDKYHPEFNDEVFATYHSRIQVDLMNNRTVMADATNLQASARHKLYNLGRVILVPIHV